MFCAMKSTSRLGTAKTKVKNKMFNRNLESKSKIIAIRKNETIPLTIIYDLKSAALLHMISFPIVNEVYSNKIRHEIEIKFKEIRI